MPKEKKLPKKLYIQRVTNEAKSESWLETGETMDEGAVIGEARHIGVYILQETLIVTGKAEITAKLK